jgi:predicted TPR repeat methyltransferase
LSVEHAGREGTSYADYYDQQAEATAWRGPEVIFGLLYRHVEPGETILDIGIGTGLGSVLFDKAGLRVFGMDASTEMLDGARAKGIAESVQLHDMTSVPYPYDDASFDHAVCVGVLQFFADVEPVFCEAGRVLRDRGMFAFTVVERMSDEPASFTAGSEHTESDREVSMYKHRPAELMARLDAAGFTVRAELEFAAFMDVGRTSRMPIRAYVAQRGPRI